MGAAPGSVLLPFTASDGENIALHEWPMPAASVVRGVVVLVHGLGEHAGRYGQLAAHLNEWGFAVRGYDQYGHGESGGQRGGLPAANRLLEDLADVIEATHQRMGGELPLVLLGHSMGGLVAADLVARRCASIQGLVLSSPLLGMRLNPVQKLLLATVPKIAPNLALGNGIDPRWLSHDREVVAAYTADPLVHDRISARLAQFIAQAGRQVAAAAPAWEVPTLLLYAGADRLADPSASRAFAARARGGAVTARCFDDLYHEIFNEPRPEPLAALKAWLDDRF